jgi:hypothetical protein
MFATLATIVFGAMPVVAQTIVGKGKSQEPIIVGETCSGFLFMTTCTPVYAKPRTVESIPTPQPQAKVRQTAMVKAPVAAVEGKKEVIRSSKAPRFAVEYRAPDGTIEHLTFNEMNDWIFLIKGCVADSKSHRKDGGVIFVGCLLPGKAAPAVRDLPLVSIADPNFQPDAVATEWCQARNGNVHRWKGPEASYICLPK